MKGVTELPIKYFLVILTKAKDSSAIENIITTHDELYQGDYLKKEFKSIASKEVHNYAEALRWGFETVRQKGILTNNHIIQMQTTLEENNLVLESSVRN